MMEHHDSSRKILTQAGKRHTEKKIGLNESVDKVPTEKTHVKETNSMAGHSLE